MTQPETTAPLEPTTGSASGQTPDQHRPTGPWAAPIATVPVNATVQIPGSKSETARALVLAALADGPSTIRGGLDARDTQLMRDGLRALGVQIDDGGDVWQINPPAEFTAGTRIDCGLAGTVMRFLSPVAALAPGRTTFFGDAVVAESATAGAEPSPTSGRPMAGLLDGLADAGARIEPAEDTHDQTPVTGLPFAVVGRPDLPGGVVTIDASASSQFVSGLLMIGARLPGGLDLHHDGPPVPSQPNIAMTVAYLRERGVQVDDSEPDRWVVDAGPIKPADVTIPPDLANAAPFLAAAAVTGGRITVPDWPDASDQPGDRIQEILSLFGADVVRTDDGLSVEGTDRLHAVDLDLRDASELTPVVAVLAALADHTSHIRGVAHIRGHETDRLAGLATDLNAVGAGVHETDDGLRIHPKLLRSNGWLTFADHRMAHAGALLGLVIDDIVLDDIGCVAKTMPDFVRRWQQMLDDSVIAEQRLSELDEEAERPDSLLGPDDPSGLDPSSGDPGSPRQ